MNEDDKEKEIRISGVASYKLDGDKIIVVLKSRDRMYKEAFQKSGLTSEGVLWGNQKDHDARLIEFAKRVPAGADLLEIGSGTGMFPKKLWELNKRVTYKGIDVLPEYIECTKNLGHNTELVNLFNYKTPHDCVIAIGTLHIGFDDDINQAVRHMMTLAKKRLIFTILTDQKIGPHYTTPVLADILKEIRTMSPWANVKYEKMPFQFEEYLIMVDKEA